MVGGVVFPPLLGWAVQSLGVSSLPPVMAALAVVCLGMVLFGWRWREVRHPA
jgi:fucose permease